jgi:hypothetical protein
MKMTIIWDAELSSLVEIDRRFVRAYCFHNDGRQSISARLHGAS